MNIFNFLEILRHATLTTIPRNNFLTSFEEHI